MPSSRDRVLSDLAGAIADREAVDWQALDRSFEDGEETPLEGLRLIAQRAESRASPPRALEYELRLPAFVKALLVLSAGQALLAVAGFAVLAPEARRLVEVLMLLAAFAFVICAAALALGGRRDLRTRPLAAFFLVNASAQTQPLVRTLGETFPDLEWIQWVRALLPECFIAYFLWRFVRVFPRVVHLDRWSSLIDRFLVATFWLGLAMFTANATGRLVPELGVATWPGVSWLVRSARGPYWYLIFGPLVGALAVAFWRSRTSGEQERRRVVAFLVPFALGLLPLLVIVFGEPLSEGFHAFLSADGHRETSNAIVYAALLLMPFATAYSIRAHRLLDLSLVLHRAARLLLARATVAVVALAPWLVIAGLLWHGKARRVDELLGGPLSVWLWAGLVTGGLFLFRQRLLRALELRLLGTKREMGPVLSRFSRITARATEVEELVAGVRAAARDLVRADDVVLLVRTADDTLRDVAGGGELPAPSALPGVLQASHKAFSLDPRDAESLIAWMPPVDREWLEAADVRLAVPIESSPGVLAGALCLGPPRTGLPYSKADAEAVTGLAAGLGPILDRILRRSGRASDDEVSVAPAGECRVCNLVHPSASGSCKCGRPWTEAVLPWEPAGKFRLEAILGQGGMGLVYEAVDLTLGRTVALKTLPRVDPEAAARLREEARSMARLLHPGLALIFGAEVWRGVPVLVVEHLAGGSLEQRLGPPFGATETLELGVKLAEALGVMHAEGLLHRDIKPSNIGFTADGEAKLLDFGLARLVESVEGSVAPKPVTDGVTAGQPTLTLTGFVAGTPLFLSPEALRGEPASVAQDLWSLHLVLWICLAGHHPFAGLERRHALARLREADIPSIESLRPDLEDSIAAVIDGGLKQAIEQRPRSAAEARDRLLGALQESG
jgi:hypothetical protein